MRRIPLYDGAQPVAVQTVPPLNRDPACSACKLGESARSVCLPARLVSGEGAGLLLVVGQKPDLACDRIGRPFEGRSERWFRKMLSRYWDGSVVFDYALRCAPGKARIQPSYFNHCRGYMAAVFEEIDPDRVLLLGNFAAKGLLGYDRGGASHCNRRGYQWLQPINGSPSKEILAALLPDPAAVAGNRFLRERFESDLEWALYEDPPKPPWKSVAYTLDPTERDAAFARRYLEGAEWVALDVETYGEHFAPDFFILSVSVCAAGKSSALVWDEAAMEPGTPTREVLEWVITHPKIGKTGANFKYDQISVKLDFGLDISPVIGDTRLAFKMLNADGDASLGQMSEMVGMGGHKNEADRLIKKAKTKLRRAWKAANPGMNVRHFRAGAYAYEDLPPDIMARYVARDAVTTAKLEAKLAPALQNVYDGVLGDHFRDFVLPASNAIRSVESNGVAIDKDAVKALSSYLQMELLAIEERFHAYDPDFEPSRPASVINLIYKKLGCPVEKRTETGQPSTDKGALQRLAPRFPVVRDLLEWRRLDKLLSTYVHGLLPFIRPDGRIHPTLLLDGTGTGRLSCKDPNLQNQPSRGGEEAKMVKDCFIAPAGRWLIQADFKTLEVMVAAMLSGDKEMQRVIALGTDFHLETAKLIGQWVWGMSAAAVEAEYRAGNKDKRSVAKTINFGTLYGQSAFALAIQIGNIIGKEFSVELAEKAQRAILGHYPELAKWIEASKKYTLSHGEAWTVWNGVKARRRPLYDVASPIGKHQGTALRSSFNTPIQGTASDFCLASLVELDRLFQAEGIDAKVVLTVHDSILVETARDPYTIAEVVMLMHDVMTGWHSPGVNLCVDFEDGPSWGSLQALEVDHDGLINLGSHPLVMEAA